MGYTTDFDGKFSLNKKLSPEHHEYLNKFAQTRRMARRVGPEHGIEGEFYVDGGGDFGQDHEDNIINFNKPPRTQPGLWCQWIPSSDGLGIKWDGGEKFYAYVEWLEYIIKNFLAPEGYILNGQVNWEGEESSDMGIIIVKDNKVTTKHAKIIFV